MAFTKEELMIEDYKTSIALIRHEDSRKADLFKLFTFAQGFFFTFYNLNFNKNSILVSVICIFAILFSLYWSLVLERIRAIIEAKYLYIQNLEKELKPLGNISFEMDLKKQGYQKIIDYKLNTFQKVSVSKTESILPCCVGILWIILLFVSN